MSKKPSSFHLTRKAKSDLVEIARYTQSQWGREQRNLYLKLMDDAFYSLADLPGQGRGCDDIRERYRKFGVGKHLIFYRSTRPSHIEIVRILHGSMDTESRLAED